MKKPILLLFFAVLIASSCKKEDPDTTPPVIGTVGINGVSGGPFSVNAGSTLYFTIPLSDNKALKQVKIDIHDNFDSHTHNFAFATQQIYSVSGTSLNFTTSIQVPSNASAGPYDVVIYAIDESGNEADVVQAELEVVQAGQPVVTINSPDITQALVYSPGDTIHISGAITDDIDLTEVHLVLERESDGTEFYNEEFILPGTSDTIWDFSELSGQNKYIIIPSGATGVFGLVIRAEDTETNVTLMELEINL